ncbi:MAG: hypothetical protein WCR30_00375 [Clostridia bacterium]
MNKIQITKSIINDFASAESNESVRKAFEHLQFAFDEIIETLSKKNPFINPEKCLFFLRDDFFWDTQTPESEMKFVLAVESAQIELNSAKLILSKKSLFKKELKAFFLKSRKKRRKKKNKELSSTLVLKPESYDIVAFQKEFFLNLADYFATTTKLRNMQDEIQILSKEEFGINISIRFAVKSENVFKFWNDDANAFDVRNFYNENQIVEKKNKETKKIFLKMVKVYSSIFDVLNAGQNSHYLAFCLLKNVPNELFVSNIFDCFLKISNYLYHTSFKNMKGIIFSDKLLFGENNETDINFLEAKKLIRMVCNAL